jgi:hypothetical protein
MGADRLADARESTCFLAGLLYSASINRFAGDIPFEEICFRPGGSQ